MKILFKQLIPQEFCLRCRGCCRFSRQDSIWQPHLLREEEKALGRIPVVFDTGENGFICANLRLTDNKCRIYANRPFECRLYPFLFNRRNDKIFLALDLNCAFVRDNSKDLRSSEYTRSLIEFVQQKNCLDTLKDNPLLAQEYEEVMDLLELKV
jgi:Fe-S-cluster containining protein